MIGEFGHRTPKINEKLNPARNINRLEQFFLNRYKEESISDLQVNKGREKSLPSWKAKLPGNRSKMIEKLVSMKA